MLSGSFVTLGANLAIQDLKYQCHRTLGVLIPKSRFYEGHKVKCLYKKTYYLCNLCFYAYTRQRCQKRAGIAREMVLRRVKTWSYGWHRHRHR